MFDNVMKNVRDGSIILMHDRAEKSYNTTAKIIDLIQQKGYEFVTVGELLGYKPYVRGGLSALAASVAPAPMESGGAPPPVTISVPAPAPAVTVVPAAPAGAAPGTALDGTPAVTVSPSLVTAPPPRR